MTALGLADRIDRRGSLGAASVVGLADRLGSADRPSLGSQVGSIGGGNRFVEIQRAARIIDGTITHA